MSFVRIWNLIEETEEEVLGHLEPDTDFFGKIAKLRKEVVELEQALGSIKNIQFFE